MFKVSDVLPACPSDKSSLKIKKSVEHWWNDTERRNPNY